jgi:hypothetical protein
MKILSNLKSRKLSMESLESRELLSVNPLLSLPDKSETFIVSNSSALDSNRDISAAAIPETLEVAESAPLNLTDTFNLHSKADSHFTIYLDFTGHTTSNTEWNKKYTGNSDIVSSAFSLDNDYDHFSNEELERIQYIWQRVAEDFAPFDVDVTTAEPNIERLKKTMSGNDSDWGIRVVISGNSSWYGDAGGVAYLGSFNWSSDTPCFVFSNKLSNSNEKYVAEAISHEVGHTLGLSHDGTNSLGENSYYTGANGWAPIMGTSYSQAITQWSKGEYADANEPEDDLAIITGQVTNEYTEYYGGNGFNYRNDDHGNTTTTATKLIPIDGSVLATGIIEQNTDVDYFRFVLTSDMIVDFNIVSGTRDANLDVLAKLYSSVNTLLYTSNPLNTLNASFSALALSAGIYYLSIEGTGKDGVYTDYGSLGTYTITGSIAPIATPVNLRKTSIGKNSVTIEWDSVVDATGYSIQYSTNQNQWTTINNVSGTSYTIDDLESSSYQYIRVRTEVSNGNSGWSDSILVRVDDQYEPNNTVQTAYDLGTINGNTFITDLVYAGDGNDDYYKITLSAIDSSSTIRLDFDYVSTNKLKIDIFSETGGNIGYASTSGYSGEKGFYILKIGEMNDVTAGKTYIIKISPETTTAQKDHYSITFNIPNVPVPPENFKSISQTHNSVTLTWDGQKDLTGYKLEYKKSEDTVWQSAINLDASLTTTTVTDLDTLTQYDFRILAFNESGDSDYETITNVKTLDIPRLPVPQNLRAITVGKKAITLDWNDVDGATGYILERKTDSGDWQKIDNISESKYMDQHLTAGTTYWYKVQAIESELSKEINATTLSSDITDIPIVTETKTENGNVTFAWSDLGNEYTYYIFKNGNLVTPNGQTTTNYIDDKPATTTEYYVYAYNAAMLKGWSHALPIVVTLDQSPVKAEILSHEITSEGGIKLNWSITNARQFVVFRNGIPLSSNSNSNSQTLTDMNPKNGNNEYVLYVGYVNEVGRTIWTWSSPYVVQKPTTQTANALDMFWADYDFNLVDDDVFNVIV